MRVWSVDDTQLGDGTARHEVVKDMALREPAHICRAGVECPGHKWHDGRHLLNPEPGQPETGLARDTGETSQTLQVRAVRGDQSKNARAECGGEKVDGLARLQSVAQLATGDVQRSGQVRDNGGGDALSHAESETVLPKEGLVARGVVFRRRLQPSEVRIQLVLVPERQDLGVHAGLGAVALIDPAHGIEELPEIQWDVIALGQRNRSLATGEGIVSARLLGYVFDQRDHPAAGSCPKGLLEEERRDAVHLVLL